MDRTSPASGGPLNIAHRGANQVAPENTLRAFREALNRSADGIELDVRLSADGVPVVIHDPTVDATTDGSGVVANMTFAQLRTLDAGGWFDPAFKGERIPSLDEVLDAFGGRTLLNLELKGTQVLDNDLVPATVDLLEGHELQQEVLVSCFNPYLLRQVRRLAPRVPLALLYTNTPLPLLRLANLLLGEQPTAIHPHHTIVDERLVAHAHELGVRVNVWTVDDPERMRTLAERCVDGIITNKPKQLRRILER